MLLLTTHHYGQSTCGARSPFGFALLHIAAYRSYSARLEAQDHYTLLLRGVFWHLRFPYLAATTD
jgi:hypothetical protein